MWLRRSPILAFTSVSRELFIRIPISTVSIVGAVDKASDKTKPGLMSMFSLAFFEVLEAGV